MFQNILFMVFLYGFQCNIISACFLKPTFRGFILHDIFLEFDVKTMTIEMTAYCMFPIYLFFNNLGQFDLW